MPYFRDQDIELEHLARPNKGFRPGQLGAIHAALSHFSVYEEPAILSLPTGYGKTAVLMALPFCLRAKRVLVVEPTDALRRQTASNFEELATLRKLGVAGTVNANPIVLTQKGVPASVEEWASFDAYDVVVSTPNSTTPANQVAPDIDAFDLIIFDEAHHAPADTWLAYLSHFTRSRFVFLTATPFRRDQKLIPGKLAYFYPVMKASKEKAFGRVSFRPAPVVNEADNAEVDRSIAQTAIDQLRDDRDRGFDHRILARAESVSHARELASLYELLGCNVPAVASHISQKRQRDIEESLIEGRIDGIVCVDMFGEGYDFPKFKVAALHSPHRSLVPTIQFIGRFARTNDLQTGEATLIASTTRLQSASMKLFEEGVDIAELVDAAAQEHVIGAEADREIVALLKVKRQKYSDYDAVTPLLLELYAHARIFECQRPPDFRLVKDRVAKRLQVVKQWSSEDGLISLFLTLDQSPPNWATSDVISNLRHDAFVLAYNEATKLCYVGSTRRVESVYQDVMNMICKDAHRPISYDLTRRVLAGLDDLRFYNVGLKNTALNTQSESYRVMTGPRAERAITSGDARAFMQGHFFGSGALGGARETIGASSSSRVWSNQTLTVSQYLTWISVINTRIGGHGNVRASQLDIVQHSKVLRYMPARVIAAVWHKLVYRAATKLRYRGLGNQWAYTYASDFEFSGFTPSEDALSMSFDLSSGPISKQFIFTLRGGALIRAVDSELELELQSGVDDWVDAGVWLSSHPPLFFAADRSSFQGVDLMRAPTLVVSAIQDSDAIAIDWTGCNIRTEFGGNRENQLLSVHEFLERMLSDDPSVETLIYDHRSGEAADFIAIARGQENNLAIRLYHCKGAGGNPSGGRVEDVYEVANQLLKSVSYCDSATLIKHVKRRINPQLQGSPSRFIRGDFGRFETSLEAQENVLPFEIFAVQPGISKSRIDEHLADLMVYGLEYVKRGGAAGAAWIVSP